MFSKAHTTPLLLAILSFPILTRTQTQSPDGVIVPFSSVLPACASLCGPLFDVQGACSPPKIASVSSACFCGDPRLQPFVQSTAEVATICGPESCQDSPDLQKIQSWYESYCNIAQTNPTTTTGASTASATSTGSSTAKPQVGQGQNSNTNQTWFGTHWKWIVMLIVLIVGLGAIWVGASLLRRRYIRKKEKEIEMRPPVAWGPHQMQGATGGYGDGVGRAGGGAAKEARSQARADAGGKRQSKGWLKKSRS